MTKKEMFNSILADVAYDADKTAFIKNEIQLLERKASAPKKPTKVQVENEGFKANILETLAELDRPVTIRELIDACVPLREGGLSNQRITHLLTALRQDGKVARTYVKKVAYFALGAEPVEE